MTTRPDRPHRRGALTRHPRRPRSRLRVRPLRRREPRRAADGDRRRRRGPHPLRHQDRRRGPRRRQAPDGRRACGRRARQRRRQGRNRGRRHGRQRADVEHHLSRRTRDRPRPCGRAAGAARQRVAEAGRWKRSSYTGVELTDKIVGVVGLGRIGASSPSGSPPSAWRSSPTTPTSRPRRAGRSACGWSTLDDAPRGERTSSSIHLPKSPETTGLIGDEELTTVKPSRASIINAARGGMVDEEALADAMAEGRVGGAGTRRVHHRAVHRLAARSAPNGGRDPTPRSLAPRRRRRRPAWRWRGRCALALGGDLVPDAVNVSGGVIAEVVRPGIPLTEKLGRVFTAIAGEVAAQLDIEVTR